MIMDCEQFTDRLADFLGQELSAEQHEAAQQHLRSCERCRELARGLQAAAAATESNVPTVEEAAQQTDTLRLPTSPGMHAARRRRAPSYLLTVIRYAAVIAIAFGGGYLYRGVGAIPPGEVGAATAGPDELFPYIERRVAQIDKQFPGTSELSRKLLLLAKQ